MGDRSFLGGEGGVGAHTTEEAPFIATRRQNLSD